ncbi:MAG: signal peptidase I, partial [Planctomycetota bacterium]|nr:signal peptidase I [Planctomycetota bacterium]
MKTTTASQGEFEPRGYHVIRDYVESIAIAVMLAFIFRMFLLEAFVIPTGSMAPTLHGRHMDITCIECGYRYQTGASVENADNANVKEVIATDCPLCRYPLTLDKESKPNERSFNGDRILVSKFSYSISDPKRWQVIVFKFPGNAKQNYIKRLVGLPGERIKITGGDIYAVPPDAVDREAFQIVRKSPRKLLAMLQLVHDSKYVPETLQRVGWPASWQPWSPDGELAEGTWATGPNQQGYQVQESNDQVSYLRYRHLPPDRSDWSNVRSAAARNDQGMLITDYYGYNRGRIAQKS